MSEREAIAGYCPECGFLVAASIVDEGVRAQRMRDQAKFVAELEKRGDVIQRVPVETVRAAKWGHPPSCSRRPKWQRDEEAAAVQGALL